MFDLLVGVILGAFIAGTAALVWHRTKDGTPSNASSRRAHAGADDGTPEACGTAGSKPDGIRAGEDRPAPKPKSAVVKPLPERGVLVPEGLVSRSSIRGEALLERLRESATPIAFDYRPVSKAQMSRLRTVPLNASAQQAMSGILKQVGPKGPTLYRAILPQGAELAKAAGGGFRGFAKAANGRITAGAVLKPIGIGGAALASWPVIATAATVMMLDKANQKQQREFQRRVLTILERMESKERDRRFASLHSTDIELSQAIARMLDDRSVDGTWEGARRLATEELIFTRRQLVDLQQRAGAVINDGKADFRRLSDALGGALYESDSFFADLELARTSIALGRKTALADAAATALECAGEPYSALRTVLQSRFEQVVLTEKSFGSLTRQLAGLELTTKHFRWDRGEETQMQEALRAAVARPLIDVSASRVEFLALPSGEVRQVQPRTREE